MSDTFWLMVVAGICSLLAAVVMVVVQAPMGLITAPVGIFFLWAACMQAFSNLVRIE